MDQCGKRGRVYDVCLRIVGDGPDSTRDSRARIALVGQESSSIGQSPHSDRVEGLIERVTYFNEDSGFCVLQVKAVVHRDLVTVVGILPSVSPGEWITSEGSWFRDKEYGLQLKATTLRTVAPTTAEGIEKYLGSGMVKGIGPIFAKRLVERFGADVLEVIEHKPADLQLVDGIGPKRRQRITGAWDASKRVREIMLFLHSHGVSTSRAVRIYKTYGDEAVERVRSNPIFWRRISTASASRLRIRLLSVLVFQRPP